MSSPRVPDHWHLATLDDLRAPGDYTLVGGPFGSDLTQSDYIEDPGVPVIRGTNLGGDESRFIDDNFVYVTERKAEALRRNIAYPGDLVFTQRGTLGQVAVIPFGALFPKYVISQSQMKLTPNTERVDRQFLYHYFRSPQVLGLILSRTQATGVPHINLGILKQLPVFLPPLPEQRRIAAILDQAEALRAKRRHAFAGLDTLIQSLFLDLFGDPNTKGWRQTRVGSVGDLQGGLQLSASRSHLPCEVPYLRVANVYRNALDLREIKVMHATQAEMERTLLQTGDLLIVEGHGNPQEIGRCALWDGSIPNCIHQNHLIRVRLDQNQVHPVFASRYLNSEGGRRDLLRAGKTTSGLNTISVSNVRDARIMLPPLTLQHQFATQVAGVERLKGAHLSSLAKLDDLFASLQHRAFRGEL